MSDATDVYVNQKNYVDGDTKPSGANKGQLLLATNGKIWEWSGTSWVLIRATTSDGSNAGLAVIADAGLVSGITNMGEKTLPVVSNATPPAGQSKTFSATIKNAVFQFCDEVAAQAVESGLVLYVVFGALNDADAKTKLDTAGLRHVIPINKGVHEFPFPDAGGAMRFDFATSAEGGVDTLVAWEVTL